MNSRSAACSVPQPLAPVGLGALGAQLCLPPREEALRGFVCVTVWIAEQNWFSGGWTLVGWVQVSMCGKVSRGGCRLGTPFTPCLGDLIHQGSTGSSSQQSFQTQSQRLTKLEKFVILSSV